MWILLISLQTSLRPNYYLEKNPRFAVNLMQYWANFLL